VTMALIAAQRRRYSGGRVELRMWVASPALLLLMPVNWDVLLTAVALAAVIAIYEDRVTESGLLLGVGTSLKLSPGFMVAPLLPLIEGWSRRLRFLGGGAVILGGSYLVYWLVRPDTWRTHLEFATTRDDYNSTIWGLLESLLGLLGIDMSNETITIISSIAVALGITALMVWVWYRRPSVVAAAALSMIVLLQLTKVFKPQYLLWVLPLLAWAGVRRAWVWVLEAAVLLQFAVIYFEIPALLDSFATMARLVAFVVVGWELIDRGRSRPAAVGGT
jgi:uncharacterized membrane protein